MSRSAFKKQSSYSEFRKKNSFSQSSLHKSMVDIQNSLSIIGDDTKCNLSSIQEELQTMVRKRSLSNKPTARSITQESLKLTISKSTQPESGSLHIVKRGSLSSLNQVQNYQKSARSINYQTFSQNFEIIEESEIHNQEDNGFYDKKQSVNKILAKIKSKCEKQAFPKKKQIIQSKRTPAQKLQIQASLNELDEIQKRLDSVKKNKKQQLKDKRFKKPELISKPSVKGQKRLFRAASQANFLVQKPKGLQTVKSKQITPKLTSKKKILASDSLKDQIEQQVGSSNLLIPTKMIATLQKQKLLKQMDRLKQSIRNTQICVDNLEAIRNMIKNMQELIN